MPKAKQSAKRKRFDYNQDRKKLKKKFNKKSNPRIENAQIRNAWDDRKSVSRNLQDMGLAFDPNRSLPIKKQGLLVAERKAGAPVSIVTKPYVLNQMEEEAGRPVKSSKTLSTDLIEYVQHMIREHRENYKYYGVLMKRSSNSRLPVPQQNSGIEQRRENPALMNQWRKRRKQEEDLQQLGS
ncbi:nucleolar protein 16 isoform X1 [Brachionichthys hirsutus]|uniref:nucleolar protein 16 isoform X1 n=1 Tax=Brachionichthys hirsutus TaxID=412623 RepID=UPI003605291E